MIVFEADDLSFDSPFAFGRIARQIIFHRTTFDRDVERSYRAPYVEDVSPRRSESSPESLGRLPLPVQSREMEMNVPSVSILYRIALASALGAATGCSAESTAPGVACPALALGLSVVYPQSGSTKVVDSQNIVVVSGTSWTSLTLRSSSGSTIVSQQIVPVPNPLPQPNAGAALTPGLAFHIPALAAATTYAVSATTSQTAASCPILVESSASFTTQ